MTTLVLASRMPTCLFERAENLMSFLHCVAMTYIWRATEMWVNDGR